MDERDLEEDLLKAWVGLNSMLKDSQMTRSLTYNEAVVMMLVYRNYRADGVGRTGVQELLKATRLLKSQMNRTVDALCAQGYLEKHRQGRKLLLTLRAEKLPDFLAVHSQSLGHARRVIDAIGAEDAAAFIRICKKLTDSGLEFFP